MKKTSFKIGVLTAILTFVLVSCGAAKEKGDLSVVNNNELNISEKEKETFNQVVGDTISIANEEEAYEIIIIEPGFNAWLQSIARPEGFHSQSFLESRNQVMVINWNQRVMQPQQYNPQLYELQIDYRSNIDYGYDVNYKLYNYFIFFQRRYNQRLSSFLPRI